MVGMGRKYAVDNPANHVDSYVENYVENLWSYPHNFSTYFSTKKSTTYPHSYTQVLILAQKANLHFSTLSPLPYKKYKK